VIFDGIAKRVATGDRTSARDNRLTLYHTFRYSWRWGLIAVVAAWLASMTWRRSGSGRSSRNELARD
jgi:hypothetical protein